MIIRVVLTLKKRYCQMFKKFKEIYKDFDEKVLQGGESNNPGDVRGTNSSVPPKKPKNQTSSDATSARPKTNFKGQRFAFYLPYRVTDGIGQVKVDKSVKVQCQRKNNSSRRELQGDDLGDFA